MPNWCSIEMETDKKAAEKYLLKSMEDGTKCVDFNILKPMPKELEVDAGTFNGPEMVMYITERGTRYMCDSSELPTVLSGIKDEDILNLFRAYDDFCESRYDHMTERWDRDCKTVKQMLELQDNSEKEKQRIDNFYAAGRVLVENYIKYGSIHWYDWAWKNWGTKWNAVTCEIREEGDEVVLFFDTAWNPPFAILEEFAKKADFDIDYEVEYNGYGTITARGGKVTDSYNEGFDDMVECSE